MGSCLSRVFAGRVMEIKICELEKQRTITLSVTEERFKRMTVLQLKKKIEPLFGLSVPDQVLAMYGEPLVGRRMLNTRMQLKDDELLSEYGITDGSTVHLSEFIYYGSLPERRRDRMGDRDGRNQSMDCLAIMWKGRDVSSESAPHPQPAAVEDLHKDSC